MTERNRTMSENTTKDETIKNEVATQNETATEKTTELNDAALEQVSGGRRPRRTGPIPLPRD